MFSTLCDTVNSILNFLSSFSNLIGLDLLFIIALGVEAVFVIFFLIKSFFSYEATLNRSLDKINSWLFQRKVVNEENIKDLNYIFKTKAPKRLCYYWQQYILFREGSPSTYLSTDNLVEKPLKTSSYNSNIKNLTLFTTIWAVISAMFVLIVSCFDSYLTGKATIMALLVPILVVVIGMIFIVYLRARKNSILNSLYQNVSLFGRFMDNACIDLPTYIDYQILFTPQEIEKGQPVLREFLDYKARKEKEEFNKAKAEEINYETYDFSSTGVDGSIVLERAMKESELFMKKKEKILVKISQLEAELDSRRKNFDNVQKDYQTKLQASKENVNRLRQMQEETTNRIESNYYRKQQTQEVAKQEQLEQEFEQQRAKYLLEKSEGEEEIKKLEAELETYRKDVEEAMLGEYQTFFNKFCQSAEKVVAKVFNDKMTSLKEENEKDKQYITELEIKLKNIPQGEYDANSETQNVENKVEESSTTESMEGHYDENGNYVYPNGTFYDKDGNFHDVQGNIYSQDGQLIQKAEEKEEVQPVEEKKVVDLDAFDTFDFMTDTSQKDNVYDVAKNIIEGVDKDNEFEIVHNVEAPQEENATQNVELEDFTFDKKETDEVLPVEEHKEVTLTEENPPVKKKAGRPKKIVKAEPQAEKRGRGRPKKVVEEVKTPEAKKRGRPKKIVNTTAQTEKRGRGRPKKQIESIVEINKKLSQEEEKIRKMRNSLNQELESAVNEIDNSVDDKQSKRETLLKEIDKLQDEAQKVMQNGQQDSDISEINARLEKLLREIKNLNP